MPEKAVLIPDVPMYRQDTLQCGPTALSMVIDYWYGTGKYPRRADREAVRSEVYSENARGTLPLDIELYAGRHGFEGTPIKGTAHGLRAFVDQRVPVIVFVDYGTGALSRDHFMVITGYTPEGFVAHTGRDAEFFKEAYFMRIWERNGRWAIALTPR